MDKEPLSEIMERIESGYSLPTLSSVAIKLVELASDDRSSAEDLVKYIEKDPPLVARLLKLANSSFFGTVHTISTLNQAVVKIGFQRLRVMALSISLRDTFPMGKVGTLNYAKFWRMSLYRGLIARYLAGYVKNANPEEAFIAGLILEIGLLVFFDVFIKDRVQNVSLELEPFKDLLLWERKEYGVDHRQIGELVMRRWNFPEEIISCQKIYLDKAESEDVPFLGKLCELARSLSGILFLETGEFESIYKEAKRILKLDEIAVNNILFEVFQQVEEISQSLDIKLNREDDILNIMEKANAALSKISEKITRDTELSDNGQLPAFDSLPEGGEIVSHTLQAVAHEIRNPLLAVGGFAKKLSDSIDPSSKGGKYIEIILEEAKRLENVLSEMTQQKE